MKVSKVCKVQAIGLDIGRGYVKGYSEFDGKKYSCKFKSIRALGRKMDFSEYESPIYIEVDNQDFFIGDLAEKEGHNPTQNLQDSKVTKIAQTLIWAALNEIAASEQVKIMLGIPNKLFKRSVLTEIVETYKGKTVKIKNKITNSFKEVTILDISIYREADAALLYHVNEHPALKNGPVALASVGFRTTELCYYDKGLKFNDKLSNTIEEGNKTALEYIQKRLKDREIMKTLGEIDSSNDYDDLKELAYESLSGAMQNQIESNWINLKELAVFVAGGTALKLNLPYELLEDPQMATSKGLWLLATQTFCK